MARVTWCRSRRFATIAGRRRSSTRCLSRCSSRSASGLACALSGATILLLLPHIMLVALQAVQAYLIDNSGTNA